MRLINADKLTDIYTIYDDYGDKHTVIDASDITGAPTINAIVIPENATNGDMIKAMFPNFNREDQTDYFGRVRNLDDHFIKTNIDWWNAPYRGTQS